MFKGGYRDWSPEGKRLYWKIVAGIVFALVLYGIIATALGLGDKREKVSENGRYGFAIAPQQSRSTPPTAVVDGIAYSSKQQTEAMTQAAKDAGLDDATARRVGEEAATLCNGNPDCLR